MFRALCRSLANPWIALAISEVLAIAGFLLLSFMQATFLSEYVHALGHMNHQYNLVEQVFDDGTQIHLVVPILVAITAIVFVGLELFITRATPLEAFCRSQWWVLTLVLISFSAVGLSMMGEGLWLLYIPLLMACICAIIGAIAIGLHHLFGSMRLLWLFCLLPILLLMGIAAHFLIISSEIFYSWQLSSVLYCLVAWGLLAIVGFVVKRLWRRHYDNWTAQAVGLHLWGIWSWAGMFCVAYAVYRPYHHLCWRDEFAHVQQESLYWINLMFVAIWLTAAVFCIVRRRCRNLQTVGASDEAFRPEKYRR